MTPQAAGGCHLGINAERLLEERAGIARYMAVLLREWAACELPFDQVTLYSRAPIPSSLLPDGHGYRLSVLPTRLHPGVWEHWKLARTAASEVQLLFCPANVVPLTYRGRVVVTAHDTLHEVVPSTFGRRGAYRGWINRWSARRADYVLTNSSSSKRDIERYYGVDADRVRAVPHGGVDEFISAASAEQEQLARRRYELEGARIVLFVGKFARRRNLPTLIRAFAQARARLGDDLTLVLVGTNQLGLPLSDLGQELGLGRALRILGYVPDAELGGLYRAAEVFAYPSDYEGLGLPVLEGMAAGTPVITLDNSSLAEVGTDAAILLPSATVDGLADALVQVASDEPLREGLIARGRARAREYSWARTARATMAALAEVAGVE